MQIELEFVRDLNATLEHKLKTYMLSNLTLREEIERLEMIVSLNQCTNQQVKK